MFASICWSGQLPAALITALPDQQRWCWFLPNGIVFKVPDSVPFESVADRIHALASAGAGFDYVLTGHLDLRTFGGKASFQLPSEAWLGIVS